MISKKEVRQESGSSFWVESSSPRKVHKFSGPCEEYADGDSTWCISDTDHRLYGSALNWFRIEIVDWAVNNKTLTFKKGYR